MLMIKYRVSYENPGVTYNNMIVDKLVSDFVENSEGPTEFIDTMISKLKAEDPNFDPVVYKANIINSTNIGEVSVNNRMEAQILDKAVETILNQNEGNIPRRVSRHKETHFTIFKRAKTSKCIKSSANVYR
jgi:hypothetical protein